MRIRLAGMVHHQNVPGLRWWQPLGRQCGTAPDTVPVDWRAGELVINASFYLPLLPSYCPSFSSLPRRESQSPSSLLLTPVLATSAYAAPLEPSTGIACPLLSFPLEKTRLRLPWCISCCHGTSARANIRDAVRATRWIDIREYLGASGYNFED